MLQRENQDSVGANTWENAGGNVEYGEELEEAMRREIKEETETITLSDEHQVFIWADEKECKKLLPKEIIADFERNKIFEYLEVL